MLEDRDRNLAESADKLIQAQDRAAAGEAEAASLHEQLTARGAELDGLRAERDTALESLSERDGQMRVRAEEIERLQHEGETLREQGERAALELELQSAELTALKEEAH